jgi:hypothetical protein
MYLRNLRLALGWLTTIPVKLPAEPSAGDGGRAAFSYPLEGVVVGAMTWLAWTAAEAVFPPLVGGALALAVWVELTAVCTSQAVLQEIEVLLEGIHEQGQEWFILSKEVGMGLVPPFPIGRAYRDALGRMNQRLAREADRVLFMVAGIPMTVK